MSSLFSKKFKAYLTDQFSASNRAHNLVRLLIISLLIFELLNIVGLLHFSPQFTWRGLMSTSLIAFLILEVIAYVYYKQKKKAALPGSLWIFTFLVIFFDFTADIFHLYDRFTWWDQILHITSSALICFIMFIIFSAFWFDKFEYKLMPRIERLHVTLYLAATATLSLGFLYEVEEYSEDLIYGTQRSGLGTDTANDLLCNFIGITIMTLALWIILRRLKKRSLLS